MLYSVTLTFIFKVKHFVVMHLLLKKNHGQRLCPADLPRFARLHGIALVLIARGLAISLFRCQCVCYCVCYIRLKTPYLGAIIIIINMYVDNIFMFDIEWRHCESCISWTLPTFLRSKCWDENISETVRSIKNGQYDIYRFWYLPSNVNIVKLYSVTVTYIFKVKMWHINILKTVWSSAKMEMTLSTWYLSPLVGHLPSSCSCLASVQRAHLSLLKI